MTPEEFKTAMTQIAETWTDDPEGAHYDSDTIIYNLLRKLGYSAGVDILEDLDRSMI